MRNKLAFFALLSFVGLASLTVYQKEKLVDKKLHIIFCDVGQGDGILIKTPQQKYILVDGGPDKKILTCLSEHMPFWHRKIDLMILTHPHLDHFFGMNYVVDQYDVKSFATEEVSNESETYKSFIEKITEKKIKSQYVLQNDKWMLEDNLIISVEAPTDSFIKLTSPNGNIGERSEFASLILKVSYGEFDALLTGDSQAEGVNEAVFDEKEPIEILHVPHHGSSTGLTDVILKKIQSSLAIISVGAKNRYKHPSAKTLDLLKNYEIKILRTDQEGSIEIVTDGQKYWIN